MKINYFRGDLTDIPAKKEALVLGDNQAALCVLKVHRLTQHLMHIDTIECRLRQWVEAKCIASEFVPTNENRADCLTNALPKQELLKRLAGMGMCHATVNGETKSLP